MPQDQQFIQQDKDEGEILDSANVSDDRTGRKRKVAELEIVDTLSKPRRRSSHSVRGDFDPKDYDVCASDHKRKHEQRSASRSTLRTAVEEADAGLAASRDVVVPTAAMQQALPPITPSDSSRSSAALSFGQRIDEDRTSRLPDEFLELAQIHSAFLRALSLHYAHNGLQTPADTRLLCGAISRIWGKRKVLLVDIQRILAIQKTHFLGNVEATKSTSELCLIDYGQARICIELLVQSDAEFQGRPLQEDALNVTFLTNMRRLCKQSLELSDQENSLIKICPVEPIRQSSPRSSSLLPLSKGQQRLYSFRTGSSPLPQGSDKPEPQSGMIQGGSVPKPSLRERLLAKESQPTLSKKTMTKHALNAKAALQRVEDVANIISLLSTAASFGQSRISFTLETVLRKLKESSKTPSSAEESEIAIRVLAEAVAPEWIKIARIGRSEKIIVHKENKPTGERVKSVLENLDAFDRPQLSSS